MGKRGRHRAVTRAFQPGPRYASAPRPGVRPDTGDASALVRAVGSTTPASQGRGAAPFVYDSRSGEVVQAGRVTFPGVHTAVARLSVPAPRLHSCLIRTGPPLRPVPQSSSTPRSAPCGRAAAGCHRSGARSTRACSRSGRRRYARRSSRPPEPAVPGAGTGAAGADIARPPAHAAHRAGSPTSHQLPREAAWRGPSQLVGAIAASRCPGAAVPRFPDSPIPRPTVQPTWPAGPAGPTV